MSSSIVFQDKLLATGNSSNLGYNFSKVELLEKRIELLMMLRQHDCVLVSPATSPNEKLKANPST